MTHASDGLYFELFTLWRGARSAPSPQLDYSTRLNRLSEAFRYAVATGRLFVTKSDEPGIVIATLNVSMAKDIRSPKSQGPLCAKTHLD